jgi:hypothetical protein
MLAEMTTEIAQLRAELESTRAVAARLAGLVRSRGAGAQLVPVRNLGSTAAPAAPAAAASRPAPELHAPAATNETTFEESS